MATPLLPSEPSTADTAANPNSITNLLKKTEEQRKQAAADTRFDSKKNLYEGFVEAATAAPPLGTILAAFLVAAGVLAGVGFLLRKK